MYRIGLLIGLTAVAAPAAEVALLETGYRLEIERHERQGDRLVLFTANGRMELPAAAVRRIEALAEPPAPPVEAPAGEEPFDLEGFIDQLATDFHIHPQLVRSIISAESNFDPAAVSHKGAIGLMQLMPETAKEVEVDPWQPDENVLGGLRYLRFLLERYAGFDDQLVRALAAYNAGPGAVDRYEGLPPYAETRAYVRRVLERFLRLTAGELD